MFVVEGARSIRRLLDDGWPLESVLLSTARAEARPDLVHDAVASGAIAYTAGQDLFDRIAGFHAHRGALALARRPPERSVASVVAGCRLVLVVEAVTDHENLGALFRNAAAFGAGAVVLDPSTGDPLYRRSVRVSVGHVLRVPFARAAEWPGDLVGLKRLGFTLAALTPAGEKAVDEVAAGAGEEGTR
ncbi:MAG TPA: TrmH family RNA methyltransferase, partial [Acidimicrobiales bacterium]|nr:TrmH family RNA methyltransferase [Acidimicrobiales bacterium]